MLINHHYNCECVTSPVPTPSVTPTIGGGGGPGRPMLPSPTPTQTCTITSTPTLTISPTPTITVTITQTNTPSQNNGGGGSGPPDTDIPLEPPPGPCESGDVYDPISLLCTKPQIIPPPQTPDTPTQFIPCSPLNALIVFNGYAFYKSGNTPVEIQGVGQMYPTCYGGHRCDRAKFIPKMRLSDGTVLSAGVIDLNNLGDGGDREASFQFSAETCKIGGSVQFGLECNSYSGLGNLNCHNGVVWIVITFEHPTTKNIIVLLDSCIGFGSYRGLPITCEELCPDDGSGGSPNTYVSSSSINIIP